MSSPGPASDDVAVVHRLAAADHGWAVIATAWVHDYAPPIRGLILATPAFQVNLFVPGAIPMSLPPSSSARRRPSATGWTRPMPTRASATMC